MATPTSSKGLNTSGSSAVRVQIGRDQNVESLGQKPVPDNPSTSVLGVNSRVGTPQAKPSGFKTLEGSCPGDHRKRGADAVLPENPGPREQMGQYPLSARAPAASTPESFPGNLEDSDAGV